ncbi:hypothetical protein SNOG_08364 [Parastagonospora nodorum SN15]|uniref:Uncharacterized protein n=1 Tax=Phaeosphaeria nodorum (strain SN15 / ATCC MYA-4574 / FGSC 10173) TaxID=321614 RepID=Q0UIQ0_PHANO|nr:hypothetical protein SNOG_08364 [Parastagonospora nodorum SN15]EAT84640.1 hypothetical protein SNOG_08364 [Parastagonospora nodorum SN15]
MRNRVPYMLWDIPNDVGKHDDAGLEGLPADRKHPVVFGELQNNARHGVWYTTAGIRSSPANPSGYTPPETFLTVEDIVGNARSSNHRTRNTLIQHELPCGNQGSEQATCPAHGLERKSDIALLEVTVSDGPRRMPPSIET